MGNKKGKAPELYRDFCEVYGKNRLPEYEGLLDVLAAYSGDGGDPRKILKGLGVKLIATADAPSPPEMIDKKEQPQKPGLPDEYHFVQGFLEGLNNADKSLEYADIYCFLNQDKAPTYLEPTKFPLTKKSDCADLRKRSNEIHATTGNPRVRTNKERKQLTKYITTHVFQNNNTKAKYEISRTLYPVNNAPCYNALVQVLKKIGYVEPRQFNALVKKAKARATEADEKSIREYMDHSLHAAHIERARTNKNNPVNVYNAVYDWLFGLTRHLGKGSAAAIGASPFLALLVAILVLLDWSQSDAPDTKGFVTHDEPAETRNNDGDTTSTKPVIAQPISSELQDDLKNAFRSANKFASDLAKLAAVYQQRQRMAKLVSMQTSDDYRGLLRKYDNKLSQVERAANHNLDSYIDNIEPLIVLSDERIRGISAAMGYGTTQGHTMSIAELIQKHVHDYRGRHSADRNAWSADFRKFNAAGHTKN